jgi:hypothetical protein
MPVKSRKGIWSESIGAETKDLGRENASDVRIKEKISLQECRPQTSEEENGF